MFVLVRALTYATFYVALLLVFLPGRVLTWAGVARPSSLGLLQIAGMVVGGAGAALALWCVLTFVFRGRGTPAPFDPPRALVATGPYRFVRNPMYAGSGLAVAGAALYYGSWALLAYVAAYLLALHLFVVGVEEPALRRSFGDAYASYCRSVPRWWPRF